MIKTLRRPAFVLALLYGCFIACLIFSVPQLPERVATHFDGSGQANGWMSRSTHLRFMAWFGVGFPLLVVVLCFLVRYLPVHLINIPRRDYWLAAERRGETCAYLLRQSLWFACLELLFLLGIHFLIVQANRRPEAQLSTPLILGLGGAFVAGTLIWSVNLIRHFRRAA